MNETTINRYIMKKLYLLILLLILFSGPSIGQNIRIHGIVTDLEGVPVPDAWIQDNGGLGYLTNTDSSGYFSVRFNFSEIAGERHYLTCSAFGYQGVRVLIDTAFQNIFLGPRKKVEPEKLSRNYPASLEERYHGYDPHRLNGSMDYKLELSTSDFSGYSDLLDSTNIAMLGSFYMMKFDGSLMLQNYFVSLGYGFVHGSDIKKDSIIRKYATSMASIELGLSFPVGSHFMINCLTGFTNYRYRLVNKFSNGDMSLAAYLKRPEIDLRFNQPCMSGRLEFGYRSNYTVRESPVDYFVGIFGGFNANASRSTLVYSRNSRLMSDQSIVFDRFIYGLKLALILKNSAY